MNCASFFSVKPRLTWLLTSGADGGITTMARDSHTSARRRVSSRREVTHAKFVLKQSL